MSVCA